MMPKKIAVLRANALGDFIFILPALTALRSTFPDAEIILLGKSMHRELLKNRPSPVDRVIVIPPCRGVGESENFENDDELLNTFFAEMQKENFDIAFQMHGGGRFSNPFVKQLGAGLTVGLKSEEAEALDISIPYVVYVNEVLRYLEVVSYVGAKTDQITPGLAMTTEDLWEAQQVIGNLDTHPFILMQPGATDPRRCWPEPYFAALADRLAHEGFLILFNGVKKEGAIIESIISKMKYKSSARNLCNLLSLSALIGVMSRAQLIVSNDTGPLHLAHALQRPSVGFYWVPNMITSMPLTTTRSRPLISWDTNCPLCGSGFYEMKETQKYCHHHTSFIADISVDDAYHAAHDLLVSQADKQYPVHHSYSSVAMDQD